MPPKARTPELAAEMNEFWHDLRVFNQVNGALYADSCTWFVPGSHLRSFDVSGEVQSAGVEAMQTPPAGLSDVEAERFYLQHCLDMPGAIPIHLNAGDFLLYRNLAWHTGLYLPYQPRATIHDIVSHPQGGDVTARWREAQKRARANWKRRGSFALGTHSGLPALVGSVALWLALCTQARSQPFQPDAQGGPNKTVLVHYMPWYAAPPTSDAWGWHWTMGRFNPEQMDAAGRREIASHAYPLIGPYDSNDPHVLEYHVLLMKLAGVRAWSSTGMERARCTIMRRSTAALCT